MSFFLVLLILNIHISNLEHFSVQCAFLGKRPFWKAEYAYTTNATASAWITSGPLFPAPTQTPISPACTASPLMLLDSIDRATQKQSVYSYTDIASTETPATLTDGTLVGFHSEHPSQSLIEEFSPMITLPPTAFESFLALHSITAQDCIPIPCQIKWKVSYGQLAQTKMYLKK